MISVYPLGLIALLLVAFGLGAVCSGYVVSVLGGLKTDLAAAKFKLVVLEQKVASEIASKIP